MTFVNIRYFVAIFLIVPFTLKAQIPESKKEMEQLIIGNWSGETEYSDTINEHYQLKLYENSEAILYIYTTGMREVWIKGTWRVYPGKRKVLIKPKDFGGAMIIEMPPGMKFLDCTVLPNSETQSMEMIFPNYRRIRFTKQE